MDLEQSVDTVSYEDVETDAETPYGNRIRLFVHTPIGDHFWVYLDEICPESKVKHLGDRGTLVIPLVVAVDRGLHQNFELA